MTKSKKPKSPKLPKKDAFLILRLSSKEKDALVALAKSKKYSSLSEMVREYLWQYIDLKNS